MSWRTLVGHARAILALGLAGCGVESTAGVEAPLRSPGAFYRQGELPGSRPDEPPAPGPSVTNVELTTALFTPYQQGRRVAGRVGLEGHAVGLTLGYGDTGYWVRPVDGPDVLAGGEYAFEFSVNLGPVPPGLHDLRLVAFDAAGRAGPQRAFPVCVLREIPDNRNACDPAIAPPAVVVSLVWDTEADLDLVLLGPGGEVLDARKPFGASGAPAVPSEALADPTIPRFERDAHAGCAADGRRRENVIFPEPGARGTWRVQARLFAACGTPSVTARVEIHRRVTHADGTFGLEPTAEAVTRFLADQADGGASHGTFLLPLSLP